MRFLKSIIPTLFFFVLIINSAKAQFDTEFWFAAPEVSISNQNFDRPIYLWLTSAAQGATVTITQPANPAFIPINVTLAAFSTTSTDLTPWIDIVENKPPNQVLNYGIKITSTAPVTIYYEVLSTQCLCNPEIFTLKGNNALGTEFRIPSQTFLDNSPAYSPLPFNSFDIVATKNNTTIFIIPSNNIVGHNANVPFSIVLNEGQTWSGTATSQSGAQHLGGSYVSSDKPIAITIKDDLLNGAPYGGCADLAGDQIIPISMIGSQYIAVRGFLSPPYDKVFITATQNNTTINVNGTLVATLNAGQTHMYDMGTGNAVFIESSAPVYVLQLSGFGCEVGLSILPKTECTGSQQVTFTRSTNTALNITLLVKQGGEGNFLLNGAAGVINATSFTDVPATGGQWKYAQIPFATSQIPVGLASQISNTTHLFHLGMIHGNATGGCRFGYFSDFASYSFQITAPQTDFCTGDTLILEANTIQGATYQWSGPSGFSATTPLVQIDSVSQAHSGTFILNGNVGACIVKPDTVQINVNPIYVFYEDAEFCTGTVFNWHNQTLSLAGTYYDSLTTVSGCDSVFILNLSEFPTYFFADSLAICDGDSLLWHSNFYSTSGVYFDSLTSISGCDSIYVLYLDVRPNPTVSLSASPPEICLGSNTLISAQGALQYVWDNGQQAASINVSPQTSTVYSVTGTNVYGCIDSAQITIVVNPLPSVGFEAMPLFGCSPLSVNFQNFSSQGSFLWLFGDGTSSTLLSPVKTYLNSGIYAVSLQVTDAVGCINTLIQNNYIQVYPNPVAAFTANPNVLFAGTSQVVFTDLSSGSQSWLWNFGTGQQQDISYQQNPLFSYDYPGLYTVWLFTANQWGCTDSTNALIVVKENTSFYVPNTFTPNNDGQNDFFTIYGNGLDHDEFEIHIYNRWGELVFRTDDANKAWNGNTPEGNDAPEGIYTWVIFLRTTNSSDLYRHTGTVLLLRN